ncbi:MAG: PASTA domain-containing protein, partial [Bacillota bacterium]|nr:PASTA domain-containing protein [Bacillota bacterium]
RALGVQPRNQQIEKKPKWDDIPMVKLPNLIGMKKKDVLKKISKLKVDASGEGDIVVRQSPEAGVRVKEGTTIRIYFGKGK